MEATVEEEKNEYTKKKTTLQPLVNGEFFSTFAQLTLQKQAYFYTGNNLIKITITTLFQSL